jgi:hypothetical protein
MTLNNLYEFDKKMAWTFCLGLTIVTTISAQEKEISAVEIIQRAIDSSGGDSKMSSIKSVEFVSQILTPENDTLSFAVKRKDFNKYYISTLSTSHVNSTTIYNNGNAVVIKDETVQRITDPIILEDLLLQCYISISYGYKKLGYKLNRLDDQKFKNFDCYVIMAESPLGKKTLNYYDKNSGNLTMTIYPNENKSVFIEFYQTTGIKCPSKVLSVDTKNKITESSLQKINYDNQLDSNWFNLPGEGDYKAPETFRIGTFKYINSNVGAIVEREKDKQVEVAGQSRIEYKIEWKTSNDYLIYRLKTPLQHLLMKISSILM